MNDDGPPTDGINILFNTTIGEAIAKQQTSNIVWGFTLTLPHWNPYSRIYSSR